MKTTVQSMGYILLSECTSTKCKVILTISHLVKMVSNRHTIDLILESETEIFSKEWYEIVIPY